MTIIENPTWTLSERMRLSRQMAGLEQQDIAKRLGVARTTVGAWESGRSEPAATCFVRWAEITGQTLEFLAAGIGIKKTTPTKRVDAGFLVTVRPEGFEPPTFCSVAWTDLRLAA